MFRRTQPLAAALLAICCGVWGSVPAQAQVIHPITGHEYYTSTGVVTIQQARLTAAIAGVHLVTINDAAEQQWLVSTFPLVSGMFGGLWIGLSDEITEGVYLWDSGEPFLFDSWIPGQPDDGGPFTTQDHVRMVLGMAGGNWDDVGVNGAVALVESPVPLTPAVSALSCTSPSSQVVELAWQNGAAYSMIEIYRDDQLHATLPGTASSYSDLLAPVPAARYLVVGYSGVSPSFPRDCSTPVVNPAYRLYFDAPQLVAGVPTSVRVLADNAIAGSSHLTGWSYGVCHNVLDVDLMAVAIGATTATVNNGHVPSFYAEAVYAEGFTVGVVVDFATMNLPTGLGHELNLATYEARPGAAGGTTALEFCSVLGVPAVEVVVVDRQGASHLPILELGTVNVVARQFLRGDSNGDGSVNLDDALAILSFTYLGGAAPPCLAAADANDDGTIDVADVVFTAVYAVGGGVAPSAPFPDCGLEPQVSTLSCASPQVMCP